MIPYQFPQDGSYEIQVRLARDRNEHVEGLREPHELEVLLDRERVALLDRDAAVEGRRNIRRSMRRIEGPDSGRRPDRTNSA